MSIGDFVRHGSGFATRKRFYAVVYLNSKKDDAVQDEFLSSFVLPEKVDEPATVPPANAACG